MRLDRKGRPWKPTSKYTVLANFNGEVRLDSGDGAQKRSPEAC